MQAEILLANRDRKALVRYLPKMERACDSIERTRDPKNNLFLVGRYGRTRQGFLLPVIGQVARYAGRLLVREVGSQAAQVRR
jgi:hypothetical protein